MKKTLAVIAFALISVAASSAQGPGAPRQRVGVPHDHTPTVHSNAPQPHK